MNAKHNSGAIHVLLREAYWHWLCLIVALLLVVSLAACGANNVGLLGQMAAHQVNGVQLGGYEVIRYNAHGTADSSLNGTLDLRLSGSDLTVSVRDSEFTTSVLLDIKYNAGNVHPVKADFHGLLGNESQVLSAAFLTQSAGKAGLGEIAIGDYKPGALNGDAVTVHFAPGASRTVSAVGTVYTGNIATQFEHTIYTAPGIDSFTKIDGVANDVHATWYCGWARADGNQDGVCNVADLTPLGINFGKVIDNTSATFSAAIADYDDNGQVAVGDLAPMGAHFGQGYEQYVVEGSDNHNGDPKTAIATIAASAFTAITPPATTPNLNSIMKSWTVDFTDTSTFTYAALMMMDADLDGTIRLWVTPSYSGPPVAIGTPAYVEIIIPMGGSHYVNITGYDIQAVGATGGTGAGSDIFAKGSTGSVVANQALTLKLNSVRGTWDGSAFTEAVPYPSDMTAADYAKIKAAVADALAWNFTNQGAAASRYTTPWFVPTAAYSGTGDPGAGAVCPDDDPESAGASREGACNTTLPAGPIPCSDPLLAIATAGVSASIGFDITSDPAAPVIEGYYTSADLTSHLTDLQTGPGVTTVYFKMTSWGVTGAMLPADGSNCKLQIIQVTGNDASAAPYDLAWDTDGTTDQDPEVGEFYFYHAQAPLDIDAFIAKIPGAVLSLSSSYAMRFFDSGTWSTINLPAGLLNSTPPIDEYQVLTLPKVYGRNFSAPHFLQIFFLDPTIRRDSRIVLNGIDGSIAPQDPVAYPDFLKDGGLLPHLEFPVSMKPVIIGGHPGYAPYPTIVMKAGTDTSDFPEDDLIADITIPLAGGRDGGRLNVDISSLILSLPPPVAGDPPLQFCYKVFGQSADVGVGRFTVPSEPVDLAAPAGVAWGINVGNRGDWSQIDFNLLATDFEVDGSTMNTAKPDVLWVRFNGGTRVLDWDEYWAQDSNNNLQLVLQDITNPAELHTGISLVMTGVSVTNDCVAIHHLNRQDPVLLNYVDWAHPTIPGGVLSPGDTYNVILDDPTTAGLDYTFAQQLSVTGANPNL